MCVWPTLEGSQQYVPHSQLNHRLWGRGVSIEAETVKQWKCYYDPYWLSYTYTYAFALGGAWVLGLLGLETRIGTFSTCHRSLQKISTSQNFRCGPPP